MSRKRKLPEGLTELELCQEAQRLYANIHSQNAFLNGCAYILKALGYNTDKEKET